MAITCGGCGGTGNMVSVNKFGVTGTCPICKGKGRFDTIGEWWQATMSNWIYILIGLLIAAGSLAIGIYFLSK